MLYLCMGQDQATLRHDNATFIWPAVTGAVEYRVVVSLREDVKIPYRSQLDTILPTTVLVNRKTTSNQEIYDRTFLSEIDGL